MQHIIEAQQFDLESITALFAQVDTLKKAVDHKSRPLEGKIMASLFYEPSTRTRFSFEAAMQRLGGSVVSTENASEFSSAAKGETLEDSIRVIGGYADVVVLRHPAVGASKRAAAVSKIPVINAGDGAGQHPTQALLDLYTIHAAFGHIDDIHVVMAGDLKYGRTVHSLAYLLGMYKNVTITFVSPPALTMTDEIKTYLQKNGVSWNEQEGWLDTLSKADVVYQTRIQKERFADRAEYDQYKDTNLLTRIEVDTMKDGAIVMHPLPRVREITTDVDDSPHAAYFEQAQNGLYVRMALLLSLLQA